METRNTTRTHPVKLTRSAAGGTRAVGYAAVFYRAGDPGSEYLLRPGFVERIDRRAFSRAISERQDVRGLFNHDGNLLLGRTSSGTMKLIVDQVGLRYEINLSQKSRLAADVADMLARGDCSGSSFSFVCRHGGEEWKRDGQLGVRTLIDVDLFDVGPVTFPAYDGTTSTLA
jgi:HK97 family phage prohead protease